jgi:hypothetical protein
MVAVAASAGDARRAGRLLGASRALRDRTGLHNAAAFSFHQFYVDRLASEGQEQAEALERAIAEGRELALADAVAEAEAETAGSVGPGSVGAGTADAGAEAR